MFCVSYLKTGGEEQFCGQQKSQNTYYPGSRVRRCQPGCMWHSIKDGDKHVKEVNDNTDPLMFPMTGVFDKTFLSSKPFMFYCLSTQACLQSELSPAI